MHGDKGAEGPRGPPGIPGVDGFPGVSVCSRMRFLTLEFSLLYNKNILIFD